MTILDRLLARPTNSVNLENPSYPLSAANLIDVLQVGAGTDAEMHVSEKNALGMAAVWRAVNLIASGAASLPLHAYKPVPVIGRDEPARQLQTSGIAADLLRSPHPDLTPFELWETVYASLLLWGNAYLQILRNPLGNVAELWPIHPSRVAPSRADDYTKRYEIDGAKRSDGSPWTDYHILHIPGFGYDGIAGLPPIRLARQGIGLAMAAERFGARLFGSGSLAGGILTTEQRLRPDQANSLKQAWKAKVSGLHNAHEVAVLDAGVKFEQLTIPPEDAQFIESRAFQIEEVARIFGIPPHMLMSNEKSTSWGTGIEQQSLGFVTYTLRPWLVRVEQRITKLLAPGPVYAKYALEGLLRGDSAQRAAFYKTMRELGALNPNEIRALEDLPPRDGGDEYATALPGSAPAPESTTSQEATA